MSMETASFILFGLGVVAFFFTRNGSPTKTAAPWAVFLMGAGVGLFVGAVWATMIIGALSPKSKTLTGLPIDKLFHMWYK